MKILKEGIAPVIWPRQITCKKCKSVLEYGQKDIFDNTDPRDNIPDYWIECLLCKNQITVKK